MQQPQFAPEQPLTVTLQAQEWNMVLGALQELPYKFSHPLFDKLQRSLMSQGQAQVPPEVLRPPNGDGRQAQSWTPETPAA